MSTIEGPTLFDDPASHPATPEPLDIAGAPDAIKRAATLRATPNAGYDERKQRIHDEAGYKPGPLPGTEVEAQPDGQPVYPDAYLSVREKLAAKRKKPDVYDKILEENRKSALDGPA